MKIHNYLKHIVAVCIVLLIVACENENVYYYTETTRSQAYGEKVSDPEEIKAKDDTTAFVDAYVRFRMHVMAYNGVLKQNPDLTTVPLPISFSLTDKAGRRIYFEEIAKQYDAVQDELSTTPDNNKAYAGAEFGMSMKEVQSIDYFKKLKLINYGDFLNGIDKVGDENYQLSLSFFNDELYSVQFASDVNYYHNFEIVKNEIINIRDVFTKAYGTPSYTYGIPNEGELRYVESKTLYRWASKNKTVSINYSRSNGGKYNMWALIVDKARNDAKEKFAQDKKRQAEEEKQARINEAASAF